MRVLISVSILFTFMAVAWFVVLLNNYTPNEIDIEYQLEVTNQTHCKIRNVETGKIYVTTYDSIQEILLIDNL